MTVLATPRPVHSVSPRLDLGPESGDHLSVRVLDRLRPRLGDPASTTGPTTATWLVCPVHVHVGGFSGDVAITLRLEELARFGEALHAVRTGVRHSATLESIEGWIDVTVTREADGTLSASGQLTDEPGTGVRLRFRLPRLEAASLDQWIAACASAVEIYTLPASA